MIWWKFRVLSEKETREGLFRIFSTKQYFRMPLEGQARCLLPFINSWLRKKLKEPTWYANTTCLWLEWTSWINSSHIIIWHTRQGSSGKKSLLVYLCTINSMCIYFHKRSNFATLRNPQKMSGIPCSWACTALFRPDQSYQTD